MARELKESSVDSRKQDVSYEMKEETYQKTIRLMKSLSCMTVSEGRIEMYQKVSNYFKDLSGYKEAGRYSAECLQIAEQTKLDLKKKIYERATNYLTSAKTNADYQIAAQEFHKVSHYMDADQLELKCNQLCINLGNRSFKSMLFKSIAAVILIVSVMIGYSTPGVKYFLANAFEATGADSGAMHLYRVLGAYKDSDVKQVEVNKRIISNSHKGDLVKIGKCSWIILDITGSKALLVKEKEITGKSYNEDKGDITWEKSTLREYLNTVFYEKNFTENERLNISSTLISNRDNKEYGTDGGPDTQDHIFLLGGEDITRYKKLLPSYGNNMWLRTPGNNQSSVMFLSVKGKLMEYGYDASSKEMSILPAMWFQLDN